MRSLFLILSLLGGSVLTAQTERIDTLRYYEEAEYMGAEVDTLNTMFSDSVLTYEEYLYWVEQYHPVAISAGLEIDLAERELRMSRGGFDPVIYGNLNEKQFKDSEYYRVLNGGVEIPTWMGLSVMAGFEDNSGVFLNPERTVPDRGLFNAGITAQLGSGLLMDNRRAALRQAQIGIEQGINENRLLNNLLYLEATNAYFLWSLSDIALDVAQNALELATIRYEGVVESFRFGDLPAIDTVEAYTQVLNRIYQLREAENNWVEAVNFASVYLWGEDLSPLNIPPGVKPEWTEEYLSDILPIPLMIDGSHPELMKIELKRDVLNIDRRLAEQYLIPKIELKYNFLSENISPAPLDEYFQDSRFFDNNYTFGAKVSYPIFVREARGKVGMNRIKIDMTEIELDNKRANLEAKLNASLVKLGNLREQIEVYTQNVEFLTRLLEAERELFRIGESSLFLINARETKLIESQNILYSLMAKEKILSAEIRIAGGIGFPEDQ
jgi:outer membrane protein TolC